MKTHHLLATVLAVFLTSCFPLHAAETPPNIVIILSDDQSYTDYSFMGHKFDRRLVSRAGTNDGRCCSFDAETSEEDEGRQSEEGAVES